MPTAQTTSMEQIRTNQELQTSKTELAAANRQVDELESQVRSTEDKHNRAEEALVESDRRFRRLVEFSPDAMFINRANRIVFANQPCLKLFGACRGRTGVGQIGIRFHSSRLPRHHDGASPDSWKWGSRSL